MKSVKRLYNEFHPGHYELFLDVDRQKAVFDGKLTLTGRKVGRPSHRITLHQKGLKIKSAKIIKNDKKNGPVEIAIDRINTHKSLGELRLHTNDQLFGGQYEIQIEFSGKITEPMHGIYPCNFNLKGRKKQLIATQFESHHAREAFPCIDEPQAKATFSLTLASPAGETAISNTPVLKSEVKGKKLITQFEKTPVMSTYLLAFAFGELKFKESQTANGVKVRVYSTPDYVGLTGFALEAAVRCLEFFEDYYGVPYPLPKLDLIGLPDFSAGAMENWGLVTFRESVLYVDDESTSIETKQSVVMVICHELAHQWFGNLVTMRWWNDLWLNESFAEIMGYLATDALFPQWNMWNEFVRREVNSALSRDSLPNVQPVQTQVNHPDEIGALFDPSIVYAKGAALINMIRNLVGEDTFRAGLNNYFKEFEYSNTVADDLWKHLKKSSGIDIQGIMHKWLTQPGFPVVEVAFQPGQTDFKATQQRLVVSDKPVIDEALWQVPLAPSNETDPQILTKKNESIKLKPAKDYPLTLNHDGRSYFVTRYINDKHFNDLLTAVSKDILSPLDKLLLVQNYLLLERAGRVGTLENIKLLPAFSNERDEAVWGMLSGIVGNIRFLIDKDEQLESKLDDFIRPIIKPLIDELGWTAAKNESAQAQKLRSLTLGIAAGAKDKDILKHGLKLYKQFKKPADLPPDIRDVVYYIGVRYGTNEDFSKLLKLHSTIQNADEKEEIAAGLASAKQPEQIERLLQMLKDDVRPQDTSHWLAGLMRNRYSRGAMWDWLQNHWDWVEQKFGSDKSYDYFPRYVAMAFSYPAQLKQFKEFFEPKSDIALKRSIRLGVEEISGRIAWRQANEASVKQWLANRVR